MAELSAARRVLVSNPEGLHARPAEMVARTAMTYHSHIELVSGSQRVDAKSILHVLTLGAQAGTELLVEARGDDAQQAVDAIAHLIASHFACDEDPEQNSTSP